MRFRQSFTLGPANAIYKEPTPVLPFSSFMHVRKSVEVFTEKQLEIDLKEVCIAYVMTNPVSLQSNHQTRFSVSPTRLPDRDVLGFDRNGLRDLADSTSYQP